ncbi:MAG TPA: protein translocase subunit SecF [Candidatus Azoamicus sp. MARI]
MNINFVKRGRTLIFISFLFIFLSCLSIFLKNFNFGLDFVGGIEIELEVLNFQDIKVVKEKLNDIKNLKIRYYGSKKCIQIKSKFNDISSKIFIDTIEKRLSNEFKIIKIDFISSEISKKTINNTFNAIFFALVSMLIYLTIRFKYIFAFSAVLVLCHDIIIVLGVISFFNIEFDIVLLSSLFAIFGYSINDTVIIFDRIRDISRLNDNTDFKLIVNESVNKTLSRTIMTSASTLLVTLSLMFFSGNALFYFFLILSFGIIVGTYSSLFISFFPLFLFDDSKIRFTRIERKVWTPRS